MDTIAVNLESRPDESIVRALGDLAGSVNLHRSKDHLRRHRVTVHQPKHDAFRLLSAVFDDDQDNRLTELHVAVDLMCRTKRDAREKMKLLLSHLVKPHRGKQFENWFNETTRYGSRKRWGVRQQVVYSDLPSKVTGESCVHLELRACGSQVIRRLGFTHPKQIGELYLRDFIDEHFRFVPPQYWVTIGRAVRGRGGARKSDVEPRTGLDRDELIGYRFGWLAMHQAEAPYPTAQATFDLARDRELTLPRSLRRTVGIWNFLARSSDTSANVHHLPPTTTDSSIATKQAISEEDCSNKKRSSRPRVRLEKGVTIDE